MQIQIFSIALSDIADAFRRIDLVGMLGWQDIRRRYRRSGLGPFWITISIAVMIGVIGVVFGQIFKSSITDYLPFLTIGMILWNFMSSVITEGCNCFISAEGIIKQLPIPLFVHILRMIWRCFLILLHSLPIYPLVLLVIGKPLSWIALLSIPGFMLVIINLAWIALLLAICCARYRDLPEIITNLQQIIFYLTPIMWMPKLLPERAGLYLLDLNPVYHFLQLTRAPLLGDLPSINSWLVGVTMALIGWIITLGIFNRYKYSIVYWL
jgi:ABC-type polysaccharide/polyol phosphate export permease